MVNHRSFLDARLMSSHGGRLYPEERREALAPDMPGACQQGIRRWISFLLHVLYICATICV